MNVDYKRRAKHRLALYVMVSVTMLGGAGGLGWLGGAILTDVPGALFAVMAVAGFASFLLSRLLICALVWVDTGVWNWPRTGLLRSIRAGWPR